MIMASSFSLASCRSAYFAEIFLKDGPTNFLSTAWQAMQFLAVASCKSATAGVQTKKSAVEEQTIKSIFFINNSQDLIKNSVAAI